MSHHDDAWWRHPRIRIRHDAHLWIRPDIARWMRGVDPADVFPSLARDRAQAEATKERARAAEDAEFDAFIARERRVQAAIQAELNEVNAELARRHREAEAKYSRSQPRVPAGNPRGGQWTDASGGGQGTGTSLARPMGNVELGDVSGSSELDDLFRIKPDDPRVGGVQIAGNLPDDPNKAPPDDPPPKVPQKEPETREGRMGFVRNAAHGSRAMSSGTRRPSTNFSRRSIRSRRSRRLPTLSSPPTTPLRRSKNSRSRSAQKARAAITTITSSVNTQGTGRDSATA